MNVGCKDSKVSLLTFADKKVLVVVVAKYVCGKSVPERMLVAVVAKVTNLISDYYSNKYMLVAVIVR